MMDEGGQKFPTQHFEEMNAELLEKYNAMSQKIRDLSFGLRQLPLNGIIIEPVDGLTACCGAVAIALVWEHRIVIDSKAGTKHPMWRKFILWHEWHHFLVRKKHGMTHRAYASNFWWDFFPIIQIPYWYLRYERKG